MNHEVNSVRPLIEQLLADLASGKRLLSAEHTSGGALRLAERKLYSDPVDCVGDVPLPTVEEAIMQLNCICTDTDAEAAEWCIVACIEARLGEFCSPECRMSAIEDVIVNIV